MVHYITVQFIDLIFDDPLSVVTCLLCSPDEGVQCFDMPDGYRCGACPPGQTGDGQTCNLIDGCNPNPCYPGVQCVGQPTSPFYRCGPCPPGYTGNGTSCVDVDEVSQSST